MFFWNLLDLKRVPWCRRRSISTRQAHRRILFKYDGLDFATVAFNDISGLGRGGTGTLKVDGKVVAAQTLEHTVPLTLMWDETFHIASDTGTPVNDQDYQMPFKFSGKIDKLQSRSSCRSSRPRILRNSEAPPLVLPMRSNHRGRDDACLISATAVGFIGGLHCRHTAIAQQTKPEIIHDAEYYILATQHGAQWATEDQDISRKLTELRQKHGTPPNIIHIMWDDTAVGEVGIPAIQKVRGFETPNINRLAAEGINFMRMYTEPSCTPSRAAVLTGCHPVRNGTTTWAFPTNTADWPPPKSRLRTCFPKQATPPPSTARLILVILKRAT